MKKLLLILAVIVSGISFSAQATKWSELGRLIASETNSVANSIEESFKSEGLNVKASSGFNSSYNSVDITLDFGPLDIVSFLNDAAITGFKESFTEAFIQSYLEDPDDSVDFPEFVKIMEDGNGEYRLIFKGDGKEKAIRITPQDFKTIGSSKFGLKF